MSKQSLSIGMNTVYNFHRGYHGRILESTKDILYWRKATIINNYEYAIRSQDPRERREYISAGNIEAKSDSSLDWIFSPHVLITNTQGPKVIMDLEDFPWLFADTYPELKYGITPNKVRIFEELIQNERLKHILWWSETAKARFIAFCEVNSIATEVLQHVLSISSVVQPVAPVIEREGTDTSENRFVAVCNPKNFQRKGGPELLEIFKKLYASHIRNWSLNLIGGVPPEYRSLLCGNTTVTPHQSIDAVQELFSRSDIFVFPSRADTYGTVLPESLNTGCYIIASHGASAFATKECLKGYPNSEVIPSTGNDGTFDRLDTDAFFETIRDMILHPRRLEQYESPYTLQNMREQMANLLV